MPLGDNIVFAVLVASALFSFVWFCLLRYATPRKDRIQNYDNNTTDAAIRWTHAAQLQWVHLATFVGLSLLVAFMVIMDPPHMPQHQTTLNMYRITVGAWFLGGPGLGLFISGRLAYARFIRRLEKRIHRSRRQKRQAEGTPAASATAPASSEAEATPAAEALAEPVGANVVEAEFGRAHAANG